MEKFQLAGARAKRHLKIADHMLTQTYPLIQDPKLLLAVMENVFLALTNSMATVLYYERLFKRIPPFINNFESKFNMFRLKTAIRYDLDTEYLTLIRDIKEMIVEHKRSPVEFSRKDKFIICSDDYKLRTISVEDMKNYIIKTKLFIEEVTNIVSKREHLFTKQ